MAFTTKVELMSKMNEKFQAEESMKMMKDLGVMEVKLAILNIINEAKHDVDAVERIKEYIMKGLL